jgi:MoaA/NifB/PqqE/SkfB family radical SAM enzyme
MNPQINTTDFNERPFIAIWEVTQACDLAGVHCRAMTGNPHAEEPCCSYVPKGYAQPALQLKTATTLHVLQDA